jgi:deoxyribodipyrimidine photo-lyase
MICPSSRAQALYQLENFLPRAGLYARDRNHVTPEHAAVSRLSPAIRHRLITEEEVASAVLRAHPFGRVEKFVQEVYWGRYWKSWLAMRSVVWDDYLADLEKIEESPLVKKIEEGASGNRVIDHFATELVTTGYLHNHARMWFAAWWVHEARLPWQSGATFFFRHLLDGDPASNTLSWRWVAGLQTPGKTYLARRGNLEKYLAPELLELFTESLVDFENPQAKLPEVISKPPLSQLETETDHLDPAMKTGLWIHEEDLSVETSMLGSMEFAAIAVTADVRNWDRFRFPAMKREWISASLQDAATRAEENWACPVMLDTRETHTDTLPRWVKSNDIQQIVALCPEVGPLRDSLPLLREAFAREGIRLVLLERPEDLRIRPFATAGFFPFWERLRKILFTGIPAV